ncbi:MAG: hypothetical protein ABFE01_18905 [Phycisphaerales bacterium]|jgi:hypothetical protein
MTRRRFSGIILASLVFATGAFLAIFLGTTLGSRPAARKTVAYRMVPTFTVFPKAAYDDQFNDPDATGAIQLAPPDKTLDVALTVSTQGLLPNTQYVVKIDTNGNGPAYDSPGPWIQVGDFRTDSEGQAQWQYRPPAGTYAPGPHTWSIFINLAEAQRSILVSDDIPFVVTP